MTEAHHFFADFKWEEAAFWPTEPTTTTSLYNYMLFEEYLYYSSTTFDTYCHSIERKEANINIYSFNRV